MLAGIMKGPSRYSPMADTGRAERRATIVLDEMVRIHAITPQQRDDAFKQPVVVNPVLANQRAQYFTDWVDDQVRRLVGEPTEDLVVETTLDLPLQASAEQAVQAGVAANQSAGVKQSALVSLDSEGRVRAYVGGVSYAQSQFDRATSARRQAGSSFKPFVYLAAMEAGRTPDTPVVDESITIGNWTPRNYTGKYLGPITLEIALKESINTVAARLANEVGTSNVAATAKRLGISSAIQLDPSMALGAVEVSPMEMAQAYTPFSNGGVFAKGYGIERIRTASGRTLYDHNVAGDQRRQVIGQPALSYMIRMMRQVIVSGTGTRANVKGYDLAGKTGTTSDYRDALVHRLHRRLRHRRLGGQGRQHPHEEGHRRRRPGQHLARLHDRRPAPPEGPADPRRRRSGPRGAHRRHRRDHQRRERPARTATTEARSAAEAVTGRGAALTPEGMQLRPSALSQARCGAGSPTRARTWAQKRGPWFSSRRWAHSWSAT